MISAQKSSSPTRDWHARGPLPDRGWPGSGPDPGRIRSTSSLNPDHIRIAGSRRAGRSMIFRSKSSRSAAAERSTLTAGTYLSPSRCNSIPSGPLAVPTERRFGTRAKCVDCALRATHWNRFDSRCLTWACRSASARSDARSLVPRASGSWSMRMKSHLRRTIGSMVPRCCQPRQHLRCPTRAVARRTAPAKVSPPSCGSKPSTLAGASACSPKSSEPCAYSGGPGGFHDTGTEAPAWASQSQGVAVRRRHPSTARGWLHLLGHPPGASRRWHQRGPEHHQARGGA